MKRLLLGLNVLWNIWVVLAWNHCSQWVPEPPEGYVWKWDYRYCIGGYTPHGNVWLHCGPEYDHGPKPTPIPKRTVWGPYNELDPHAPNGWAREKWGWVEIPYADPQSTFHWPF